MIGPGSRTGRPREGNSKSTDRWPIRSTTRETMAPSVVKARGSGEVGQGRDTDTEGSGLSLPPALSPPDEYSRLHQKVANGVQEIKKLS